MITRPEAIELLNSWVESASLRRHCLTLELVMRAAASRYGEPDTDTERWGMAGLLHDADWDKWPEEHPHRIVEHLRALDEPEIAQAIACHGSVFGIAPQSRMDKALYACDEMTGLIVACALMRPDGVLSLTPASVLKKMKDRKFAAGVDREEVAHSVELLEADMREHIAFIIEALRPKAAELAIAGNN